MSDATKGSQSHRHGISRRSLLTVVGASGLGGITGCLSLPTDSGGGGPITMGGILPLTGSLADPAQWVERAWNLRVKQANENGGLLGRDIELTIYDSELTKSKMQSQTSRLLSKDNVDIFLGPYPTITMPVISPILERQGMTVLHQFWPTSHIRTWLGGEKKWPHQFGFSAGTYTYPQAFVKFMASLPEETRPKRVALIGRNDIYGEDSEWAWKHFMNKHGDFELVASESYKPGSTDLSRVIRTLQGTNADLIASNSYMDGSILVVQAIADVGLQPDAIWASVGPQIPSWIPALKGTGEYVFGSTPYAYSVPTDANEKLSQAAQDNWGTRPHYSFGFGVIQFDIYIQAIEEVGEIDHEQLMETFKGMTFNSVTGKISFKNNFSNAPMFVTQVDGEEIPISWPREHQTKQPTVPLPDDWPNQKWP